MKRSLPTRAPSRPRAASGGLRPLTLVLIALALLCAYVAFVVRPWGAAVAAVAADGGAGDPGPRPESHRGRAVAAVVPAFVAAAAAAGCPSQRACPACAAPPPPPPPACDVCAPQPPPAAPCAACPAALAPPVAPLPPPPPSSATTAAEYRYNPAVGFAGGLVPRPAAKILYLPPDYCFVPPQPAAPPPPPPVGVDASWLAPLSPADVAIDDAGDCHWADLKWRPATGPAAGAAVAMCTHDPAVDVHVSHRIHTEGFWVSPPETASFASVACTPERPFMLDIGSNIGSYGVMAAALGCQVVFLDPMVQNLGRALESVRRLGALDNATFLQNAIGIARGVEVGRETVAMWSRVQVRLGFSPQNPGASSVLRGSTEDEVSTARTVVLDDLFSWPGRPINKRTGRPLEPADVAFIKVDVEGFDVVAYYSMQRLLQEGAVPFATVEFNPRMAIELAQCDAFKFVRHQHEIGYRFYGFSDAVAAPASYHAMLQSVGYDSFEERPAFAKPRGHQPTMEGWWVHESAFAPGHPRPAMFVAPAEAQPSGG